MMTARLTQLGIFFMEKAQKFYGNVARLSSYYYSFDATNNYDVDVLLHAVAKAGKSFHHTEQWCDELEPYSEYLSGKTPSDWIQNAANSVAKRISVLEQQRAELLEALEQLEESASYAGIDNIAERFAVAEALDKARKAITRAAAEIGKDMP